MINITPAPPTHTAEPAFSHYNTHPRKSQCGIRSAALQPRIPGHPLFLVCKLTVSHDAKAAAVLKGHTSCGNPLLLHMCRQSAQRKSRLYTVIQSYFAIEAVPGCTNTGMDVLRMHAVIQCIGNRGIFGKRKRLSAHPCRTPCFLQCVREHTLLKR